MIIIITSFDILYIFFFTKKVYYFTNFQIMNVGLGLIVAGLSNNYLIIQVSKDLSEAIDILEENSI